MAVTFDPINKYILIPDVTSITAQSIYNDTMDWIDENSSMGYDIPMEALGYANLGGGAYSDKIFILRNDWKLKPFAGTYTLTVIGTLIALDEDDVPYDRTVPPDSGYVQWVFQVTSQGIVVATGSGVTTQDKQDIADLVETQTGAPIKTAVEDVNDIVSFIKKLNEGRWKIVGNQLIIYDTDNVTPIKTFNLSGSSTTPYSERVPV